MNRRDFFRRFLKPLQGSARSQQGGVAPPEGMAVQTSVPPLRSVAAIMAKYCLPYQGHDCCACSQKCPVPNAIVLEDGLPRVVPEVCTGCEACADACPPPTRAILFQRFG